MAGVHCRYPREKIVPYVDRPEESQPGQAHYYASVCNGCSAQCGVLVKSRSGRPIKLKGNPDHPVNGGSLCSRGEASYRRLYDPDRAESPLAIEGRDQYRELDWEHLDKKVEHMSDVLHEKEQELKDEMQQTKEEVKESEVEIVHEEMEEVKKKVSRLSNMITENRDQLEKLEQKLDSIESTSPTVVD